MSMHPIAARLRHYGIYVEEGACFARDMTMSVVHGGRIVIDASFEVVGDHDPHYEPPNKKKVLGEL